ncbi:MAG: MerR family transcriptional regulator [Myxococcota bacterium]
MGYRIKTVSELTGIPKNTLVAWERRYGVVQPRRAANGYREYREEDVALLMQLKGAIDQGMKISEAVTALRDHSLGALTELRQHAQPPLAPVEHETRRFAVMLQAGNQLGAGAREVVNELLDALMQFDRPRADHVVRRLIGVPFFNLIDELYLPLFRAIRRRFEDGSATVAQEHHATTFLRDQLTTMLMSVGSGPERGLPVACIGFPGEHGEVPTLAVAVRLALTGCRVTYLGADLPLPELGTFVEETEPAWLCVSAFESHDAKVLLGFAEAARSIIPAHVDLAVGGPAISSAFASRAIGTSALRERDGIVFLTDWRTLPPLEAPLRAS